LALDIAWRFPGMPEAFYRDWLRIAAEEALHFTLLRDHLVRQRTEEGAATGPHDHPGAETAHDIGPHEADVGHVER
ncbi:DUF455 family protein, partial [Escherichia coli]|uniref:DUF455 family protein n=1 Tax=Escherichia coli TaxID=562 RepID=UPI00111D671E